MVRPHLSLRELRAARPFAARGAHIRASYTVHQSSAMSTLTVTAKATAELSELALATIAENARKNNEEMGECPEWCGLSVPPPALRCGALFYFHIPKVRGGGGGGGGRGLPRSSPALGNAMALPLQLLPHYPHSRPTTDQRSSCSTARRADRGDDGAGRAVASRP